MLTGTNLNYTKAYNYRIVFETIRLQAPISRADIARNTQLTAQTVSNIVARLQAKHLIVEGERTQNGRGAPSTTLEVNPRGAYSVGIDFNRDHLTGILADLAGKVRAKVYYEIDAPEPEEAVQLIAASINQLIEHVDLNYSQISGVGIALPGPLEIVGDNVTTNAVNPKLFPKWKHVPIIEMLAKETDLPVYIENNASSAALGERWYGIGRTIQNFMYVFFGIGLGAGLVLNGQLYNGINRNAGEIGFIPIAKDSTPLSVDTIPHIGEHFNLNGLYAWLGNKGVHAASPEDIYALFRDKNEFVMQWLDTAVDILLPTLATVEYILDPEILIFGGRYHTAILEYLRQGVEARIKESRAHDTQNTSKLLTATAGTDAAALGAATLPMFNLFAANHELLLKK